MPTIPRHRSETRARFITGTNEGEHTHKVRYHGCHPRVTTGRQTGTRRAACAPGRLSHAINQTMWRPSVGGPRLTDAADTSKKRERLQTRTTQLTDCCAAKKGWFDGVISSFCPASVLACTSTFIRLACTILLHSATIFHWDLSTDNMDDSI